MVASLRAARVISYTPPTSVLSLSPSLSPPVPGSIPCYYHTRRKTMIYPSRIPQGLSAWLSVAKSRANLREHPNNTFYVTRLTSEMVNERKIRLQLELSADRTATTVVCDRITKKDHLGLCSA